jgi:hypothetical protein
MVIRYVMVDASSLEPQGPSVYELVLGTIVSGSRHSESNISISNLQSRVMTPLFRKHVTLFGLNAQDEIFRAQM